MVGLPPLVVLSHLRTLRRLHSAWHLGAPFGGAAVLAMPSDIIVVQLSDCAQNVSPQHEPLDCARAHARPTVGNYRLRRIVVEPEAIIPRVQGKP